MAIRKPGTKERSPADIKKAIAAIEAETEKERRNREREGETFTSMTREELLAKLQRAESPMIIWQSWSTSAPPGGTIDYNLGVMNPDPVSWGLLSVAVTIGNRNPIVDNDVFLSDFDHRFPTLAQPTSTGFSLGPLGSASASTTFRFALAVPPDLDRTGYFGNTVLQQNNFHGVGKCLDRAMFFFGVV